MLQRLLRNLARFPRRTVEGLSRELQPVYRHRRAAKARVRRELSADRVAALSAVPGNSSDWQCMLLYHLACSSAEAVSDPDAVLLEIGAFKGKSTAWLAEAARKTGRGLVSIDPLVEGTEAVFRDTVERFAIGEVAELHKAFSHDLGTTWDRPIAFLWIDGGHDYDTVQQDVIDFAPHVRPGGYVVFDDVNPGDFAGLVRAVDETIGRDDRFEHLGEIKHTGLYRRRLGK